MSTSDRLGAPDGSGRAMTWAPVVRPKAYEHVIDAIEQQILDGNLTPGDRLPGERALAEALGISRTSVREAMRVLESMGVVTAAVGSGRSAGSFIANVPSDALTRLLRIHVALSSFGVREVIETRVVLEVAAAQMAATRATPEEVARLHAIVDAMAEPDLAPTTFNELDTALHVGIAEASGNALLGHLMHALRGAIRRDMVRAFDQLSDWRASVDGLVREHRSVLDAIGRGDAADAGALVRTHIEAFHEHRLA